MKKISFAISVLALTAMAQAETPAQAAFSKIKGLVGTWKGQFSGSEFEVNYKLIGSGSAIVETQFPGTATEMVTVYHMDNGKLVLTHYCAAGNQPSLKFVPGKDSNRIDFKFHHGSNMKLSDSHMHDLTIVFKGPDEVVSVWKGWDKGKLGHTAKFELTRQSK